MKNNNTKSSCNITLSPALGDWTSIKFINKEEEINISKISKSTFDILPYQQLKYTSFLHYRLAEYIIKKFSHDMNIKIELFSIQAHQISYEEFLKTEENPIIQADLITEQFERINILFDWKLAEMIVNRLTGGKGEASFSEQFSQVEQTILKTQIQEILPYYSKLWKNIFTSDKIDIEFNCGKFIPDQKTLPRETYILFDLNFSFGENGLVKITIAYPNHTLRNLLTYKSKLPDPIKKRLRLTNNIYKSIKIPIVSQLGSTQITMKDIKQLQEGDILTLDKKITSPISINIGSNVKLFGQIGTSNRKISLQLIFPEENAPLFTSQNILSENQEYNLNLDSQENLISEQESFNSTEKEIIEESNQEKTNLQSEDINLENDEELLNSAPETENSPTNLDKDKSESIDLQSHQEEENQYFEEEEKLDISPEEPLENTELENIELPKEEEEEKFSSESTSQEPETSEKNDQDQEDDFSWDDIEDLE